MLLDRSARQLPAAGLISMIRHTVPPCRTDPLLTNFRTVRLTLLPSVRAGCRVGRPGVAGDRAGYQLQPDAQPCGDWKWLAGFRHPFRQITVSGRYRPACGERNEYVAVLNAGAYSAALPSALWEMGGELTGQVIEATPADARLWFSYRRRHWSGDSRYQQVQQQHPGPLAISHPGAGRYAAGGNPLPAAGQAVRRWLAQRGWRCLSWCWKTAPAYRAMSGSARPVWPPCSISPKPAPAGGQAGKQPATGGVRRYDETAPARPAGCRTCPHQDGLTRRVRSIAGYVHAADGRKWVIVGIVNHPAAANANPALDRWIDWVAGGAAPSDWLPATDRAAGRARIGL